MHPLSGVLPLSYVPARVTRRALVAHRHSFAPPRCRTSQYHRSFVPLSVSLWNDLSDPVFDGVRLAGFKSRVNAFSCWHDLLFLFCLLLFYLFLPSIGWLCGVGVFVLTECPHSLPALHRGLQNNNNNNNNNYLPPLPPNSYRLSGWKRKVVMMNLRNSVKLSFILIYFSIGNLYRGITSHMKGLKVNMKYKVLSHEESVRLYMVSLHPSSQPIPGEA